jgi:hypothetical protein
VISRQVSQDLLQRRRDLTAGEDLPAAGRGGRLQPLLLNVRPERNHGWSLVRTETLDKLSNVEPGQFEVDNNRLDGFGACFRCGRLRREFNLRPPTRLFGGGAELRRKEQVAAHQEQDWLAHSVVPVREEWVLRVARMVVVLSGAAVVTVSKAGLERFGLRCRFPSLESLRAAVCKASYIAARRFDTRREWQAAIPSERGAA